MIILLTQQCLKIIIEVMMTAAPQIKQKKYGDGFILKMTKVEVKRPTI